MSPHIEDLPDEMLLLILQYLPTSSLVSTAPDVSVRWRRLTLGAQLWRGRTVDEHWSSDASAVSFFSRGPSVHSLSFKQCVGDAVLRCVAHQCPSLTVMCLHHTQDVALGTLRAVATGLPRLRVLDVGVNVLTCPHKAQVVATLMPSLETLTLNGYWGDGGEPRLRELAGGCPSLRRLHLDLMSPARLSDLGPVLLGRLRGLTLPWESLTRDVLLCVASLQELTLESYDDTSLPNAALADDLRTLTALTRVDVTYFCGGRVLLEALMQPTLSALTLFCCPTVDDALLLLVCQRCPLLEDLDVSCCHAITALGLSQLWRLRGLRRLCLSVCEGLGGGSAEHLAQCQGLQELILDYVDLRSLEPGVSRLLELRKMRVLMMDAWSARDLVPWEELPKAFPNLRVLGLGYWMSLDTTFLERLKAALPKVEVSWRLQKESDEDEHEEPDIQVLQPDCRGEEPHDIAFQLGLEKATEMARGKYLKVLSRRS